MSTSRVRVGVRVRPLLSLEKNGNSGGPVLDIRDNASLSLKGQVFTYDHVFNSKLTQTELYTQTASPMLKSFLEGYNVTIIAYGQTGSGKTYTMGTSDLQADSNEQGLIPRFLTDLFENISSPFLENGERLESSVSVSFLEIYGEDVFDLMVSGSSSMGNKVTSPMERASLTVREDDKGHAVVQGLREIEVKSAENALEHLDYGTKNRITGKTNMNAGSSRSHAVFTVSLKQSVRSSGDDVQHMTSKLTFVDLAGSERIKRTGAEGQRLKEGIQINSGLFNLGQVINSLADEQKLKQGSKNVHVPYRNSKLTHLLKDALGGNSQTLFLACVSPAEVNENETLSTLNYAKQARNIQNKPVQNMDQSEQEIRRLRATARAWMLRCVHSMFTSSEDKTSFDEEEAMALMKRGEVRSFLEGVESQIGLKLEIVKPSPRKIRLSLAPHRLTPVKATSSYTASALGLKPSNLEAEMLDSLNISEDGSVSDEDGVSSAIDPEESERLVSRMIEMVSQEREKQADTTGVDGSEGLEVDKAIEEKEVILQQLLQTVKGYATLKSEYEKLLETIGELERERKELESELERAKQSNSGGIAIETMKTRYATVAAELESMRQERKKKETAYIRMQRESKQCEALRQDILKLKESKISLLKQQKSQVALLAKIRKEQQAKVEQFKRGDVKKQQQLNNLKSELTKKDRILHHKQREISRIASKLHACEEHVSQLLKIQNRNRKAMASSNIPGTPSASSSGVRLTPSEVEHLQSAKLMLDNLVNDRLDVQVTKKQLEHKFRERQEVNTKILTQANVLDALRTRKNLLGSSQNELSPSIQDEITSAEEIIDSLTSDIELLDADLRELAHRLDVAEASSNSSTNTSWEELSKDILSSLSTQQVQQLSWDLLADKASLQESLLMVSETATSKAREHEVASERIAALMKHIAALKSDNADKLKALDAKYKNDTWALVKSNNNARRLSGSKDISDTEKRIAIERAIELQTELEAAKVIEFDLKREVAGVKAEIALLQQQSLVGGPDVKSDAFMSEIQLVWDEMGLDSDQRRAALDEFVKDTKHIREGLVGQQRSRLLSLKQRRQVLTEELSVILSALGLESYSSSSAGLVTEVESLEALVAKYSQIFRERAFVVTSLKERLLDYMMEMWLDGHGIKPVLQQLIRFPSNEDEDIVTYARDIVKATLKNGAEVVLSEELINTWEGEIRTMNIERLSTSTSVKTMRDKLMSVVATLEVDVDQSLLLAVVKNSVGASSTRFGPDDEEMDAVARILRPNCQVFPGSSRLAEVLEYFLVSMEDMSSNRRLLMTYLDDIVSSVSLLIDSPSEPKPSDATPSLTNVQVGIQQARDLSSKISSTTTASLSHLEMLLSEWDSLSKGIRATKADVVRRVNELESSVSDVVIGGDINCIDAKFNAVKAIDLSHSDIKAFGDKLEALVSSWNSFTRDILHKAVLLMSEAKRVEAAVGAFRDVQKIDQQLLQQVTSMEEFEIHSKQDRMKLLTGNSRALVEEEKFRKSSKRKYEHLTERLLAAASNLQLAVATLPPKPGNGKFFGVELSIEFSGLTPQAQMVLKGKASAKENTSLMHLHTMTHGTRHWTGDSVAQDDIENASSVSNGAKTTAPVKTAAVGKRRS